MKNQRGEVVTGLMVVMMAVMMIFGGMHMMHGEHKSEGDHAQIKHKHSDAEDMHQTPEKKERATGSNREESGCAY